MSNSKPSTGMVGGMEAVIRMLERTLKELKQTAVDSEVDQESRRKSDREIRRFLLKELIAAREEIETLKNVQTPRNENDGIVEPVSVRPRENDPQVVGSSPLLIFPVEVWRMLFDNLTASSDLASIANASQDFRKELWLKRTEFLFEKVLPILIQNGVFPQDQLSQNLLDLRQVCRSGKAIVDNFLENHPCHFHLNDVCHRATSSTFSTFANCFQPSVNYNFYRLPRIFECQALLETLPVSSLPTFFIGRSITFSQRPSYSIPLSQMFWLAAASLLEMEGVGISIWHCKVVTMKSTALKNLSDLLRQIPNLKTLRLNFIRDPTVPKLCLKPLLDLPKLKNLQVLMIKCWKPIPFFVRQLLVSYKHVQKLGLEFYDDENELNDETQRKSGNELIALERIHLPNLEALSTVVHSEEGMLSLGRLLLNYTPALQNFSLILPNYQDFNLLFNILEQFEKPLKTLSLTLGKSASLNPTWTSLRIRKLLVLPHLEALTIDTGVDTILNNIDFILPLKSLQKLTIIRRNGGNEAAGPDNDDEESVITFQGLETRLYESNLWKLLPNLDQVIIKMLEKLEGNVWNSFAFERAHFNNKN